MVNGDAGRQFTKRQGTARETRIAGPGRTGIDYLGEAERLGWPYIENPSGLIDRDGVVKPAGWERAAWWSDTSVVKIARRTAVVKDNAELVNNEIDKARKADSGPHADWTPRDLRPHTEKGEIYSNVASVELFVNGQSLGKKQRPPTIPPGPGTSFSRRAS